MFNSVQQFYRIVIVGGGAGGLELATQLGNRLGKKRTAEITLVDAHLTHVWKPLWHEVAAGTYTSGENEINYIVQAYQHHFRFQLGEFIGLDKEKKQIKLAAVKNRLNQTILPERTLYYDLLVIAIGSVSHDFGVPGVKEHCYSLDSYGDCQNFHQQLLSHLIQMQDKILPKLNIAIVGGGATGIELAAELQFACQQALKYEQGDMNQLANVHIKIIESSPKLLPELPEKISTLTYKELQERGIEVLLNDRAIKIDQDSVYTQSGLTIAANLKVWAAGIKAPDILATLGLETNKRNQLVVHETLQTVSDKNIFAFGDCAFCPQPNHQAVPPRAQAAHQQAMLLAESIIQRVQGQDFLPSYHYRDYGSLITLAQSNTLGNLMGKSIGNVMIEGKIARWAYLFLHLRHQAAVHGWWATLLATIAQVLTRKIRPRLKLH